MQTVAIVGTGLIGGSFGLALRAAGFGGRIVGVSSPGAIEAALAVGAIDRASSLEDAARAADLIFLAQPVRRIVETLPQLEPHVRPDALVTDAGSTKQAIVNAARSLTRCTFLGGHPMAGREKTGAGAADANLFRNRPWVLTPATASDLAKPAASQLRLWIESFGAQIVVMDAAAHDRTVAFTSHLPQLLSTALAASVSAADTSVSGPGLLDMTRLALSSFDLWKDILATNSAFIGGALQDCIDTLTRLREATTAGDEKALRLYFERAQQLASEIRRER